MVLIVLALIPVTEVLAVTAKAVVEGVKHGFKY